MKEHDVEIFEMEILKIEMPVIEIRISCSKGTYIRSIAKDFGEKLGCGAYMKNLRRTKIGNFSVNDAISLDNLQEML
jgi:tRNA pseudouridine55 synthase